ncbi:MAG TPA: threonine synthase [Bacillota bacterium]|nr:threonine synthase [Bacillota bacterium]
MRYVSTRGRVPAVSAAEAIRQGIASDGGLYTPEQIPRLTETELTAMVDLSYQELAAKILGMYLTDYPAEDLKRMIGAAYAFPEKFGSPEVTPVTTIGDGQYLLELYHGPTCAFKDVALQLLPHLLTKASELTGDTREIVILVATSGDTGKAALEGFKDVPGTRIIVFFPEEGVSQVQRLQMVTQEGQNTEVIAVQGNFDDAQNAVKQIFTDPGILDKMARHGLTFSSANSINWGRLVPQIVYYFYGYMALCRGQRLRMGDILNVVVPTGNFGNILAAYFAKQMGLPLGKLICASNSNNVLTDFIKTGRYNRNRDFHLTISPSMDILISSNLERLLFYLTGQNADQVCDWMSQLKSNGEYRIGDDYLAKLHEDFYGGFATEAETMDTIGDVYQSASKVIDTHTAVGQSVYKQYLRETGDRTPMLLASTASPFKFNASVVQAIAGEEAVLGKDEFELLHELQRISGEAIPQALEGLNRKAIRHQRVCKPERLGELVQGLLKIDK